MIIGKLYTHYKFVHYLDKHIKFLIGPRGLVPNLLVYRLMVGSV